MGYLVQCLSLGRPAGYVQVVRADDVPRRLALSGRAGAVVKEAICRMAGEAPATESVHPGRYRSPRGPVARPARSDPAPAPAPAARVGA
ncbi:hypothetical protein [Cellulomonas sp. ATA003]|uniref:hypothetical protein n=1 Tax=Cellulomonas sp. ATA003 TaxID=3073064 RepID=UPI0028730960|nr:hypothetical protein [Cellulomonas sp. ATA003]WNB86562.1 hypothetical protein REH70_04835 [Cellulomonas sp. ATA003]